MSGFTTDSACNASCVQYGLLLVDTDLSDTITHVAAIRVAHDNASVGCTHVAGFNGVSKM